MLSKSCLWQLLRLQFKHCSITSIKTVPGTDDVRALSLLDTSKWVTILGIRTKELTLNFLWNEGEVQVKRVKCPLQRVTQKQLRNKVFSSVRNYFKRGEEMCSMLKEAVYENAKIRRKCWKMWNPVYSDKVEHSTRLMYATNTAKVALSCAQKAAWTSDQQLVPPLWQSPSSLSALRQAVWQHRTYYWTGPDRHDFWLF